MKVEILTEFKHEIETYYPGEVCIFDITDPRGEYFCRAGWAKDLDGVIATGTPSLSDVVLFCNDITEANVASTLEV